MSQYFSGKVVIITGSSMGIGKALAIHLCSHNARVVLNARNEEKLTSTKDELAARGMEVVAFAGDVTNDEVAKNLIQFAINSFGRLDVLVNNAGTSMRGRIETVNPDVVRDIYEVNTISPLVLSRYAMPFVKESKGHIIFISSLAGLRGLPLISIYSSAKMALTSLADALRVEHQSDHIHIGIVYVGITEVEQGKNTVGADGELIPLDPRSGFYVASTEQVAVAIGNNIRHRKKKTVIGIVGKAFYFINRYLPVVLEFAIKRSYKKSQKLYN